MRLILCLLLLSLSPQDRVDLLRKAATPAPATRPGYVPGDSSGVRAATWFDSVREYGALHGIDVLNDPDAITKLMR